MLIHEDNHDFRLTKAKIKIDKRYFDSSLEYKLERSSSNTVYIFEILKRDSYIYLCIITDAETDLLIPDHFIKNIRGFEKLILANHD